LVIVTKLGARRPPDKSWQPAISPADLTGGVHDNLRNLGVDALDVVNYRAMGRSTDQAKGPSPNRFRRSLTSSGRG
jgi:aryl-alcohol dehydrogenase-like predicted oxidoreductase